VPGAYGAEMRTKKGVFGVVAGHQNRHLLIDPKSGAPLCRGWLRRQYRRRARAQGDNPGLGSRRLKPVDRRLGYAQPDGARLQPRHRRSLGIGAGVRRPRRQSSVRLSDPGPAGRVLWLALRLYPQAPDARLRQPRPRQGRSIDHPGPAVRCSLLDLVFYEGDQFPVEYKAACLWL
jgi:hypothetical protein